MKFGTRPRRCCAKVSTHCCLRPTGTRSVWGEISKRVRSKSYVEQSCFDYSVVSLQWYSSCTCTSGVTDAEGIGQTHQSLKVWGDEPWHFGDDCGIFGDGKEPPLPCCSMLTRGNCSLSPVIRHPPTASGCFAVHSLCRGVRYRSSSKFVVSLSGKSAVPSSCLPPQLGPRYRRGFRVIRF